MRAPLHSLFAAVVTAALSPLAYAQGASPPPAAPPEGQGTPPAGPAATPAAPVPTGVMPEAPPPAPAPAAAPAPAPEPGGVEQSPSNVPGGTPASPAPPPPPNPAPPTPAPGGPEPPGTLSTTIATPAETGAEASVSAPPPPRGLGLGIELGVGMAAGGRFPESDAARTVEEAVDTTFGLAAWLGSRRLVFGLAAERTGLGRDHYATNTSGETKEATYGADSLSLLGRWYLTESRPSMYLGLAVGPAFGTVRTTGTRAPIGVFVTPGESYSCSANGSIGATASASAGVEFEVAGGLSIVADARATGFFLSRSANSFGGCAPGTGNALVGVLRLGASYRFAL